MCTRGIISWTLIGLGLLAAQDLIQPHFDEVSAFGYGNTIQAAKDMIQDSLETSETANAA